MLGFAGTLSQQFGELAQPWEEAGIGRGDGGAGATWERGAE